MVQRILFETNHIASYFAQATLLDYLDLHLPSREDYEFIVKIHKYARFSDVLRLEDRFMVEFSTFDSKSDDDLSITIFNNWDRPKGNNRLEIGEFLLKNCAPPWWEDQLEYIRTFCQNAQTTTSQ